jgi:hypothetical protein
MDGFGGGMVGVIGSFGWSMGVSSEIHAPGVDGNLPYWLLMLLASGHEATEETPVGDFDVIRFAPTLSNQTIANFSTADNDHNPTTVSLSFIRNNNQTDDTVIRMKGCTGASTFSFVANERAIINTAFVGTLSGSLLDDTDVDVALLGDYPETKPYVVKAITLALSGSTSGVVNAYGLQNLEFNTGFETPEFVDPTETWGFGISPPILNSEPTVSFSIMNTSTVDKYLADALLSLETFSITVTLVSPDDSSRLIVRLPKCQYTGVSETDVGGYAGYQIEAQVVRNPGEETLYQIDHLFKTTP